MTKLIKKEVKQKVLDTIESCETLEQIEVSKRLLKQFYIIFNDENDYNELYYEIIIQINLIENKQC